MIQNRFLRRTFLGSLLVWATVLMTACASLRPEPPQLSVISVRPVEMGFAEQKFAVLLRIHNPNRRDFVLNKLDYRLEVDGQAFARGVLDKVLTLPAEGDAVVELPVAMRLGEFLTSAVGQLLVGGGPAGKGQMNYQLIGNALIDGLWAVPFDKKGVFDFSKVLDRAR